MTRIYICPCCDQPAQPRTTPMSPAEMVTALRLMERKGLTPAELLTVYADTLDHIAPGMTAYIRALEYCRERLPGRE